MVGAIGGVGIGVGGGIGIGGASGDIGAIGGLPGGDVAGSEGPASAAPAAPPAGIQVSISMAARQALTNDMTVAVPGQSTGVQVNAGIDQLAVNVQIQGFSDLQNWDELIAALILALLLQNRKDNGS